MRWQSYRGCGGYQERSLACFTFFSILLSLIANLVTVGYIWLSLKDQVFNLKKNE